MIESFKRWLLQNRAFPLLESNFLIFELGNFDWSRTRWCYWILSYAISAGYVFLQFGDAGEIDRVIELVSISIIAGDICWVL